MEKKARTDGPDFDAGPAAPAATEPALLGADHPLAGAVGPPPGPWERVGILVGRLLEEERRRLWGLAVTVLIPAAFVAFAAILGSADFTPAAEDAKLIRLDAVTQLGSAYAGDQFSAAPSDFVLSVERPPAREAARFNASEALVLGALQGWAPLGLEAVETGPLEPALLAKGLAERWPPSFGAVRFDLSELPAEAPAGPHAGNGSAAGDAAARRRALLQGEEAAAAGAGAEHLTFGYEVLYNSSNFNSLPSVLSLLNGALLASLAKERGAPGPAGPDAFRPAVRAFPKAEEKNVLQNLVAVYIQASMMPLLIVMGFLFAARNPIHALVLERETKAKNIQYMMGVRPTEYWASQLALAALRAVPVVGCALAILAASGVDILVGEGPLAAATAVVLLLAWVAVSAWTWVFQLVFNKADKAMVVAPGVLMALFFLTYLPYFAVGIPGIKIGPAAKDALHYLGLLYPPTNLAIALQRLATTASNRRLRVLLAELGTPEEFLPRADHEAPWHWSVAGRPLAFQVAGFALVAAAVVALDAATALEEGALTQAALRLADRVRGRPVDPAPRDLEDAAVRAERQRVDAALPAGAGGGDGGGGPPSDRDHVLLRHLHKRFRRTGTEQRTTTAVRDLCLGVDRGECFALLGTNGAGKTTTLSILLDELRPTAGAAAVAGVPSSAPGRAALRRAGFCPQANVLFRGLSGRAVATFFCRLRGVRRDRAAAYVGHFLAQVGLGEHADKPCEAYSGGNKRKLCAVIALCGRPDLVVLDEPTAGVDPVARRALWRFLNRVRSGDGGGGGDDVEAGRREAACTVLLTTHYMDEADRLGSRIGIMSRGQLACLGTSQDLKTRYGAGYELQLKGPAEGGDVGEAIAFVEERVGAGRAEVVERPAQNFAKMRLREVGVAGAGVAVPDLLEALQGAAGRLGLAAFTLSQSTLEQIFLRVAKAEAEADREAERREAEEEARRKAAKGAGGEEALVEAAGVGDGEA